MGLIVAIDGPAGAGKSTVAKAAALKLGFGRVDTGAIYRALTFAALGRGVDDPIELVQIARSLVLCFKKDRVFLHNEEVTESIRSAAVTSRVSYVSAIPEVRLELLELQRRLGRAHPHGAVLEGRDIGTVVFPDAEVKVYLTATDEERARRRHAELCTRGETQPLDVVLESIRRRDAYDESREAAPLRVADGATVVDTTGRAFSEVVDSVVGLVRVSVG